VDFTFNLDSSPYPLALVVHQRHGREGREEEREKRKERGTKGWLAVTVIADGQSWL
jgi:hypothetical protein